MWMVGGYGGSVVHGGLRGGGGEGVVERKNERMKERRDEGTEGRRDEKKVAVVRRRGKVGSVRCREVREAQRICSVEPVVVAWSLEHVACSA